MQENLGFVGTANEKAWTKSFCCPKNTLFSISFKEDREDKNSYM